MNTEIFSKEDAWWIIIPCSLLLLLAGIFVGYINRKSKEKADPPS
jgi:hypothetical protein